MKKNQKLLKEFKYSSIKSNRSHFKQKTPNDWPTFLKIVFKQYTTDMTKLTNWEIWKNEWIIFLLPFFLIFTQFLVKKVIFEVMVSFKRVCMVFLYYHHPQHRRFLLLFNDRFGKIIYKLVDWIKENLGFFKIIINIQKLERRLTRSDFSRLCFTKREHDSLLKLEFFFFCIIGK